MGTIVAGATASLSDRASSSFRRNSSVMTACTAEIASRNETSALHLFTTTSNSPMPEWPYARDETWVFEPSGRGTNLRSNVLQRGSSAPSGLFHECLADFHSELEVPFQDGDDALLAWVDQNLAPIGPHQTDTVEVPPATTSTSCSQQFLVAQAGFNRQISSITTATQTSIQGGGYGAVPAIQESPSFDNRTESMISASEDLIYHGMSANSSTVTSAYSVAAADHQISYELRPGGSGLWSSSTAPGMTSDGLRGPVEPPSGWLQGSAGINVAGDAAAAAAPSGLIRHSSLPVLGGTRAIRGSATHPRSIAERVRRGKISERMKRLQDLVPNIDPRQSNTADMLDEVVEYVKQLQLKVEELSQTVVQLKLERAMHPD